MRERNVAVKSFLCSSRKKISTTKKIILCHLSAMTTPNALTDGRFDGFLNALLVEALHQ
jgi:hypothetical protein